MLYFKPIFKLCFRMTKCTFHKFGTSGNIEKHDALCILPLNIGDIFKPIFISATMRETLFSIFTIAIFMVALLLTISRSYFCFERYLEKKRTSEITMMKMQVTKLFLFHPNPGMYRMIF